jgi:hypothetical protein
MRGERPSGLSIWRHASDAGEWPRGGPGRGRGDGVDDPVILIVDASDAAARAVAKGFEAATGVGADFTPARPGRGETLHYTASRRLAVALLAPAFPAASRTVAAGVGLDFTLVYLAGGDALVAGRARAGIPPSAPGPRAAGPGPRLNRPRRPGRK